MFFYHFGKRSVPPCSDCDGDQCTMNCGPCVPSPEVLTQKDRSKEIDARRPARTSRVVGGK